MLREQERGLQARGGISSELLLLVTFQSELTEQETIIEHTQVCGALRHDSRGENLVTALVALPASKLH